jgi:hypothetical protein
LDDSWVSNSVLKLFTDSAGGVSKGCGIYFDGKWACLNWPSEWEQGNILKDITYLVLIPIALARPAGKALAQNANEPHNE